MRVFNRCIEVIGYALAIVVGFSAFAIFLVIAEPLSPAITIFSVLGFTLLTFDRWPTAIMSVAGIAVYAISWQTMNPLGKWSAALICLLGIIVWMTAVGMAFSRNRLIENEYTRARLSIPPD